LDGVIMYIEIGKTIFVTLNDEIRKNNSFEPDRWASKRLVFF